MNVTLVSDLNRGGAAIALRRLLFGLKRISGVKAEWVHCGTVEPNTTSFASWPAFHVEVLRRLSRGRPRAAEYVRLYGNTLALQRFLVRRLPDIVNLHNLHESYLPSVIRRLPEEIPLVWTMHDMWPLTGYCCYSEECRKFEHGCLGDCPLADRQTSSPGRVENEWRKRHSFYQQNAFRLSFVTPSRWLAGCAQAGFPGQCSIRVIPYGLPLDVYRPLGDRRSVRAALGLPEDAKIVMCGAMYTGEVRKGGHLLKDACALLRARKGPGVMVVAFGIKTEDEKSPEGWTCTGLIRDEALLNLYYNAADVFVLPSLADNLPNTLIEATAAGTPCVTFDVGGCPEIVRDGETGFVARAKDVGHLAECIEKVLDMGEERRREMSEACRRVAVAEYDVKLQAKRYVELFEEMVKRNG